jgi:hypothetical protein
VKSRLFVSVVGAAAIALLPLSAQASSVGRGELFFDGMMVRTLVPPSSTPHEGTDTLFEVTNGAAGQLGVAAVAPGMPGYHGGRWAVDEVTFNTGITPYLLTSAGDVMSAEAAGDVTVMRDAAADFHCPIQP